MKRIGNAHFEGSTMDDNFKLRWLIKRDLDYIVTLDASCWWQDFRVHQAYRWEPWTETHFLGWLGSSPDCVGLVVETDDQVTSDQGALHFDRVIGYCLYRIRRHGIILERMAIHPEYQRMGAGRKMVERLLFKLRGPRRILTLAVPERNLPAQQFFRSCGIKASGVWSDPGEDGVIMFDFEKERVGVTKAEEVR
jgi:ribosomal protein S18 acetylase RimI-like enzyme